MAKKSEAKKETITAPGSEVHNGIMLDRVRGELLLGYFEANKIKFAPVANTKDKLENIRKAVDAYQVHVAALKQADKALVVCTIEENGCGAWSSADLDCCPVCGARDQDDVEEEVEEAKEQGIEPDAVKQLDLAVVKVKKLAENTARNLHALGTELAIIHKNRWYKARRDASKMPVHKTWEDFCQNELEMSGRMVRNVMDVAKTFSEELCSRVGFTKLLFVAKAEGAEREHLLKMVQQEHASVSEVRDEVQRLGLVQKKPAVRATGGGGEASRKPEPAPEQKPKKGELTVVYKQPVFELKLKQVGGTLVAEQLLMNSVLATYTVDLKKGLITIKHVRAPLPQET